MLVITLLKPLDYITAVVVGDHSEDAGGPPVCCETRSLMDEISSDFLHPVEVCWSDTWIEVRQN